MTAVSVWLQYGYLDCHPPDILSHNTNVLNISNTQQIVRPNTLLSIGGANDSNRWWALRLIGMHNTGKK